MDAIYNNIRIKCDKCGGPVWEEELPDTHGKNKMIDLVCLMCGMRKFYLKRKYLEWKRKRSVEHYLRG